MRAAAPVSRGARRIAPEVIQTSMMDCGPASLLCALRGFGIPASYGRLREACQTAVDGTSISTIDEVARMLGLDAEETMLPFDHLLEPAARALPAIVVVRTSVGATHFLVVWSIVGPWVQVMDPARGRIWMHRRALLDQLYRHRQPVPAGEWRAWFAGEEMQETLAARMDALSIAQEERHRLCARALADPGWRSGAALDGAIRAAASLVRAGAIRPGREALAIVDRMAREAAEPGGGAVIPAPFWSVDPAESDDERLVLVGAVLIRIRGRRRGAIDLSALPRELAATLSEQELHPIRAVLDLVSRDDRRNLALLVVALVAASALVPLEAVLLRSLLVVSGELGTTPHRLGALGALVAVLAIGMALEWPLAAGALHLGRTIELRLRVAFLDKIPRLTDRYFHSRLVSDMAERGHHLWWIRILPFLGLTFLRASAQLVLTAAAIAWLEPGIAPLAFLVALLSIGLPLLFEPALAERDLRLRTHAAALSRFYFDALLGLVPIRVHGARNAVEREHEATLVEWSRAALRVHATATWTEGLLVGSGLALGALMVFAVARRDLAGTLLLVYWALSLPVLGQQVAASVRQYPILRSAVLRLLEPLRAPEETAAGDDSLPTPAGAATAIHIRHATVEASGHVLLEGLDLAIAPGEQVAVVGPSGAGKSSLLGLLLGWHRPSRGRVEVDGRDLDSQLVELRRQTAWLDPSVQLWNRSVLDNLLYGRGSPDGAPLSEAMVASRLSAVLERLPGGLQTQIGENGGLLSAGEAQRLRLARAMLRSEPRLVLLDEPFSGLDRDTRQALMAAARSWWPGATLLCVTHDVADTIEFDRVLVIEGSRLVEDGRPVDLLARPGSRYARLAAADRRLRDELWSGERWRRLRLERGTLSETERG